MTINRLRLIIVKLYWNNTLGLLKSNLSTSVKQSLKASVYISLKISELYIYEICGTYGGEMWAFMLK